MQEPEARQQRRVGEVAEAAHALSEAVRSGDAAAVDQAVARLQAAHRRESVPPVRPRG